MNVRKKVFRLEELEVRRLLAADLEFGRLLTATNALISNPTVVVSTSPAVTPQPPAVAIYSDAAAILVSDPVYTHFEIRNSGSTATPHFAVEIRVDGQFVGSIPVNVTIQAGQKIEVKNVWLNQNGAFSPGLHDVEFRLDANGQVGESNETNNIASRVFGVVSPASQSIAGTIWNDVSNDGIQDAWELPLSNVKAFVDENANDTYDSGEPFDITDANGQYEIENLMPGSYRVTSERPAMWEQSFPGADGGLDSAFEIELNYRDPLLSTTAKSIIESAANRWADIIRGDLHDEFVAGVFVDDIVINVLRATLPPGIIGKGSIEAIRTGAQSFGLPSNGSVIFDSNELVSLVNSPEGQASLFATALHEIGHTLGIGTRWISQGLIDSSNPSDLRYTGANAVREYQRIFPNAWPSISIPVESNVGMGSDGGHWRESVLNHEIMTSFLNLPAPLSLITVGSAEDLGFLVDYAAADLYVPGNDPAINPPNTPAPVYGAAPPNTHLVTVGINETVSGIDFGNREAEPEIDVQGNGRSIASGDLTPEITDDTDFGLLDVAFGILSKTFTIANLGAVPLELNGSPRVTISGPHASDFLILTSPAMSIAPQDSSDLVLFFNPSKAGVRSATISIASNDSDEPLYQFAIQGTGTNAVPPMIESVKIAGSNWQPAFLQSVDPIDHLGYPLPKGPSQFASLPWESLNTFHIQFSEDVGSVTSNDVEVRGVQVSNYDQTIPMTVNYDQANYRATVSFTSVMGIDKLLLVVKDSITDLSMTSLDGEWQNGVSLNHSGDLNAGGDFKFRINIVPGDTNQNGKIAVSDLGLIRVGLGSSTQSMAYSKFADLDGSGGISVADVTMLRTNLGRALPAADPLASSAVAASINWNEMNARNLKAIDAVFNQFEEQNKRDRIRRLADRDLSRRGALIA